MTAPLPVLFFDRQLPAEYVDLVNGRARAVGPADADLAGADGVIAGMHRWDAEAIAKGPRLRVISRSGVGYDTVDVAAANAAGITVCYTPEAPTVSTAEHAMALILAITKDLPALQDKARQGLWGASPASLELDGCVLGVVGFGRIARRVAVAASALGMTIVAHDPYVTSDPGVTLVGLDELLGRADVVTIHAPATPETRHLINAATLAKMKRGSYLVNCARGTLVDQDALLAALDAGHIAGAGLDVTDPEPLPVGHRLLEHPRVLVTPHVASGTVAGRRRLYAQAIDNALNVLAGRPATIVPQPP
jgi:D-3-phosphoglycerate dehydrogenase / 2-oxoglutarate reductase